jgi:hypothetical protein
VFSGTGLTLILSPVLFPFFIFLIHFAFLMIFRKEAVLDSISDFSDEVVTVLHMEE